MRTTVDSLALRFECATDAEREGFGGIVAHAFGFPAARAPDWLRLAGHDNVYACADGDELVGGMIFAPMGQWFGGRSISTIGLAGVAVAPERRGTGAGAGMMRAALSAMKRRGAILSTLYPSAVPFYRSVGYERAGARFCTTLDPAVLGSPRRDDGLVVSRVGPETTPELVALQSRWAARHAGALDRGPYVWRRALEPPREEPAAIYAIRRDGALVGHLALVHKTADGHDTEILVTDACADDGAAVARIFGILGGYRSICSKVRWHMHVPSLFSMSLADRRHETRLLDHWLLRVLDPPAALAARGYARGIRARVAIEVDDPDLPETSGSFTLEVDGGSARVTAGAETRAVALGPRGLASMLAGFMPASELARLGLASGDADDLAVLDDIFRGPLPTLAEMF